MRIYGDCLIRVILRSLAGSEDMCSHLIISMSVCIKTTKEMVLADLYGMMVLIILEVEKKINEMDREDFIR